MTRHRIFVAEYTAFIAAAIDQHLSLPIDAHQHFVVLALDPKLTDDIARLVIRIGRIIQFGLADFAGCSRLTCAANPFCGYKRRWAWISSSSG